MDVVVPGRRLLILAILCEILAVGCGVVGYHVHGLGQLFAYGQAITLGALGAVFFYQWKKKA